MSLVLNSKAPNSVEIDNKHEEFEGTEYSKAEFVIQAKPLSLTQEEEIRRRYVKVKRGVEVLDNIGFLRALFIKMVTGWTGISFGEGDVPCSQDNKELVFEHNFDFANRIIMAIRAESERVEVRRQTEEKN